MTESKQASSPYVSAAALDSPVALVITQAGPRRNAMTASCFSEVAHHPTSLWVSIRRETLTHELIEETNRFTLCVLDVSSAEIARRCAEASGRDRDKCAGLDLYDGPEGFLFCSQTLSSTACEVTQKHQIDDHTLYIADILAGEFDTTRTIRRHLLVRDLT